MLQKNQWIDVKNSYNIKFLSEWMTSISDLIHLQNTLSNAHNEVIELIVQRLNQDCLEKFFGNVGI